MVALCALRPHAVPEARPKDFQLKPATSPPGGVRELSLAHGHLSGNGTELSCVGRGELVTGSGKWEVICGCLLPLLSVMERRCAPRCIYLFK